MDLHPRQPVLEVQGQELGNLGAVAPVVNQNNLLQHLVWSVLDQAPDRSETDKQDLT